MIASSNVGDCVKTWVQASDEGRKREMEHRIAELLHGSLLAGARSVLVRSRAPWGVVEAEDAAHQGVLELPRILTTYARNHRDALSGHGPRFTAYAVQAVIHITRDILERSRRQQALAVRLWDRSSEQRPRPLSPLEHELLAELGRLLDRELRQLGRLDQRIVRMRAEKATFEEIGQALGKPPTTCRSRFDRCAEALRRRIERALGGHPCDS